MKRTLFAVLTVIALAEFVGCASENGCRRLGWRCAKTETSVQDPDESADPARTHCGPWKGLLCEFLGKEEMSRSARAGQPAGVEYPYYTTRGPRDFYAKELPSIGP